MRWLVELAQQASMEAELCLRLSQLIGERHSPRRLGIEIAALDINRASYDELQQPIDPNRLFGKWQAGYWVRCISLIILRFF